MKQDSRAKEDLFFIDSIVTSRYERFKLIMTDRGIETIQKLADMNGISRSLMSLYIHEKKEPSAAMKIKIAESLKTDTLILFGGENFE